jgi:hypothetical protein
MARSSRTHSPSNPRGASARPRREAAEGSREALEHERTRKDAKSRERKLDDAVDMTFPASDPAAPGRATGTEPARRPVDRKAPLITKEDIERAAKRR